MKMDINTGMKMTLKDTVTMDNAAKTLGSGSLLVYGTPASLKYLFRRIGTVLSAVCSGPPCLPSIFC